jgi:hypothetical protein
MNKKKVFYVFDQKTGEVYLIDKKNKEILKKFPQRNNKSINKYCRDNNLKKVEYITLI